MLALRPAETPPRRRRRGVVLVLILAMMGLLAAIGVMFAMTAGQAQLGAKKYAQGMAIPTASETLDFALERIINDSNDPLCAIRGHGLLRDMYGNDAGTNGFLATLTDGSPILLTAFNSSTGEYTTNVPTSGPGYFGLFFLGWTVRVVPGTTNPNPVTQTLNVTSDNISGAYHVITLSPTDSVTTAYGQYLAQPTDAYIQIVLDGRYHHAFNGPGATTNAVYGNFRVAGFNPNSQGLDEDYDAPDLENWFLALQSADGSVMIPSYHRPGIIRADPTNLGDSTTNDWLKTRATVPPAQYVDAAARFLRPRAVDGHDPTTFPNLIPDPTTGLITYDLDNDGDGVSDSVWLDLGHPVMRDATGKMFKPLYGVMILGLNGRFPLNTVGNLQARDLLGVPTFTHTSHLGYSVNEINPMYALHTVSGVSELVYLLKGGTSPTGIQVAGRWGEKEYAILPNNNVGPGRSTAYSVGYEIDPFDDDYDTYDNWSGTDANGDSGAELGDRADGIGAPTLPVERFRRFVTPLDLAGTGRVVTWDPATYTDPNTNQFSLTDPIDPSLTYPYSFGGDHWGRVSFYQYFRPPGVPGVFLQSPPTPAPPGAPLDFFDLNSNSLPDEPFTTIVTNRLHGYESFRNPAGPFPQLMAAMPHNLSNNGASPPTSLYDSSSTYLGTFDSAINSTLLTMGWNDAAEMNLYSPNAFDEPYGPHDLEWLYRRQDVDGDSLSSRLASLASSTFLYSSSAGTGRRLFSTDVWETNRFAWAPDNPGGVFPYNSRLVNYYNALDSTNPNNSQLASVANSSFQFLGAQTPQLAHGDRKINLNFPLPISNNPDEPVRQKWVLNAYLLCKQVLPPLAVDTPEECAQLSQFLLNVIDFRDQDSACTHFVNPDVWVTPATGTTAPVYSLTQAAGLMPLHQFGMEYNPVAINEILAYQFLRKDPANGSGIPTQRMFIELVNTLTKDATITDSSGTVLSGSASNLGLNTTDPAAPITDLAGWDLVRLDDDPTGRPDPLSGQVPTTPDPADPTGVAVIPLATIDTTNSILFTELTEPSPSPPDQPDGDTTNSHPNPGYLPALTATGDKVTDTAVPPNSYPNPNYYYVIGNNLPDPTSEDGPPAVADSNNPVNPNYLAPPSGNSYRPPRNAEIPTGRLIPSTGGTGKYYWLYLRRPANPFDPASTKVVVDSFRFSYVEGGGVATAGTPDTITTHPTQEIYSSQRLQPYRGGQLVPVAPATTAPTPPNSYGYSEQTAPPPGSSTEHSSAQANPPTPLPTPAPNYYGKFGALAITKSIIHSLGKENDPNDSAWQMFPFHDRDFMSVAELLLVPGCPPGLFTKRFTESPATTAPGAPPPTTPPTGKPSSANAWQSARPRAFPYLPENFYYTAYSPPAAETPGVIGGPTGMGWFKMMEFFEVPSTAFGAIGSIAQGQDFDWLRQDIRPGQINLNLIIDPEVFLGVMDDGRLNLAATPTTTPPTVPQIVTLSNPATGAPVASYPMANRGLNNALFNPPSPPPPGLPQAFADFLRLGHGGSNYLFGLGMNGAPYTALANARPFHSLSYPDINYTLMRPAFLPPVAPGLPTDPTHDPGLMNPTPFVPQIPARRLFQVPDTEDGDSAASPPVYPSNASETGDPVNVNDMSATITGVTPWPLALPLPNLVDSTVVNALSDQVNYLGGNPKLDSTQTPPTVTTQDRRQHPYFRTEWLQKLMNLTTVRTHQYAVWVTVGFFEVRTPGNAATGTPDTLGAELNAASGRNIRYRAFFVLDRTRATGYNPTNPDDFHKVIIYRRVIE